MFLKTSNDNNGSPLLGIWAARLNFDVYNKMLQSLDLARGDRIVLLDKNGVKIADSDISKTSSPSNQTTQQSPFTNLQSFKNATNGKTATVKETFDGSQAHVFCKPVKAIQNNWVIPFIKPVA